jgi:acyl carrier protein
MTPVPPFLSEFAHLAPAAPVAGPTAAKASPGACVLASSAVEAKVMGSVRAILGADVSVDEPFMNAGLDSLGAVELRNAVNAAVRMELPSTVVFDYPSVGAMTGYIVSQMADVARVRAQVLRTISKVLSDGSKETRSGNYNLIEAGLDSLGR